MHLSQPDGEGKTQRACTPQSHDVIRASEALFRTQTTPIGYQDLRDVAGGVLELGLCRNCGSTIAHKLTEAEQTMWELGIGDVFVKCARKGCRAFRKGQTIWCHAHQETPPSESCDNVPAIADNDNAGGAT